MDISQFKMGETIGAGSFGEVLKAYVFRHIFVFRRFGAPVSSVDASIRVISDEIKILIDFCRIYHRYRVIGGRLTDLLVFF